MLGEPKKQFRITYGASSKPAPAKSNFVSVFHIAITPVSRFIGSACLVSLALHAIIATGYSESSAGILMSDIQWRGVPAFDKVMVEFVQKINCTAGTLAISEDRRLLYERGYGWLDRQHKTRAPANAYIGIASCEKPMTAAAVRQLARKGKLSLNAPLFDTLGIQAGGRIVDERVNRITFEQVLHHQAGWGGDIRGELEKAARAGGRLPPFDIPQLLSVVRARPLETEPGKASKYSNFGFDVLRYAVERFSRLPPGEYYREQLLQTNGCKEVGQPQELSLALRQRQAVWNLKDGGPIFASTRYMCAFMEDYWLTGEPRTSGNPLWVMYGSLPGSTALMIWRPDGMNIAAIFNGRNETTHDEIRAALEAAVKQYKQELITAPATSLSQGGKSQTAEASEPK
jgi:CubicO group peptidase (beta-lactamase class C family)